MQHIVKAFTSVLVVIFSLAGCLGFLAAPLARYISGEESWLWAALIISVITLMTALVLTKVAQALE